MKLRYLGVAILATMGVTPAITATLPATQISDRIAARLNGLGWMRGPIGGEATTAKRSTEVSDATSVRTKPFDMARLPFVQAEGPASHLYLQSSRGTVVATSLSDGVATVAAVKRAALSGRSVPVSGMSAAGSTPVADVVRSNGAGVVFPSASGSSASGSSGSAPKTVLDSRDTMPPIAENGSGSAGGAADSGSRTGGPNGDITTIFVPGIGVVPEPSTWAMLVLGFGAIGFATRRRSRHSRVWFS